MKKLFVLLLALAVVTGAFAQVTTAISLSGGVKLIDQDGWSAFEQDGANYDVLTFKATSEDGYGFSISDADILGGGIVVRDWNVWFNLFDGKAKFIAGNLRNGDFRMLLPVGKTTAFGATDRITGQGFILEVMPMDGLTLGLSHPVATTRKEFMPYTLKGADIGAAYTIADVGKVIFQLQMNQTAAFDFNDNGVTTDAGESVADALVVNAGFSFTGMEGLTANVIGKFVSSEDADASHIYVGAGALYTMDKLEILLEGCLASKPTFLAEDDVSAPTLLGTFWDVYLRPWYTITDNLYAYAPITFNQDSVFTAKAVVGYDFLNGLQFEVGGGIADEEVVADVYFWYSVAF